MIKACRLITGEYMISKITEEHEGRFVCEDPLLFETHPQKDPNGTIIMGVGFQPLIPAATIGSKCIIKDTSVMFWINDLAQGIVDKYNELISPVKLAKTIPDIKLVR